MKNPSRHLSRVIHSSIPLVIRTKAQYSSDVVAYLAANVGYYAVLPMSIITTSETIAMVNPSIVLANVGFRLRPSWLSRRNHIRALRGFILFWCFECDDIHHGQVSICRWTREIHPCDVWGATSKTHDSRQGIGITRGVDLYYGCPGEF
jgi:hypothetical protein